MRPCASEEKDQKQEKKTQKSDPLTTHHEIHNSPPTATNSRRCATKHVPRVSLYSTASINLGFVEIGLVQLSQSVKTTNVTHTHRHTNQIMAPCAHKTASVASLPWPCLISSREVNEAVCVRGKKINGKKNSKIRPTQNTPRNPQHPAERDHLEKVTKHVPRVSPYSPASIDPGFVEIGLVQPS